MIVAPKSDLNMILAQFEDGEQSGVPAKRVGERRAWWKAEGRRERGEGRRGKGEASDTAPALRGYSHFASTRSTSAAVRAVRSLACQ